MTALTSAVELGRVRRVQTGARAILVLGIGASLSANVLAADPSFIGRVIAAWSPLALLLTVELLSRVPLVGGWLSRLRVLAAAAIAGIAAWVSYWHMAEVALSYGEASVAAHLLPFSVDGLVVVAAVCLVELANRISDAEARPSTGRNAGSQQQRKSGKAEGRAPSNGTALSTSHSESQNQNGATRRAPGRSSGRGRSSLGDEVRRLAAEHSNWTQADIAQRVGCSVRTVRRHLTSTDPDDQAGRPSTTGVENKHRPTEKPSVAEVAVR